MELSTKNKTLILKYKTRRIVSITQEMKIKNFEELYFNAMSENSLEALAKIIYIFGEDKNSGLTEKSNFPKFEDVYDFIDSYMEENKKTYAEMFKEIAEDINKMGFFNSKMTTEELEKKISSHISVDIDKIISQSAEKAIAAFAENEIQISKG